MWYAQTSKQGATYRIVYPKTNKIRGTFHSTELRPYYEAPTTETTREEKNLETNQLVHQKNASPPRGSRR